MVTVNPRPRLRIIDGGRQGGPANPAYTQDSPARRADRLDALVDYLLPFYRCVPPDQWPPPEEWPVPRRMQ